MKKTISMLMAVLMLISVGVIFASADEVAEVYVTISDMDGKLALAYEPVTVSDIDGDEVLTINDALYAAHEQFYEGGAAAGYASEMTKYGLSLTKLWGSANGYSYGYMVNDVSAWSLADPVKTDDYVAAYVFTDLEKFSDKYSFFDVKKVELKDSGSVSLTLTKNDFDDDWSPVTLPVVGAELTVDGEPTGVFTDEEGKASLDLDKAGEFLISATAKDQVIVAPVCLAKVDLPEGGSTPDETTDTPGSDNGTDDKTSPSQTVDTDNDKDDKSDEKGSTNDEATNDESTNDESTNDTSPNGNSPKTNDITKMWLWILIAGVCLCGVIGAVVFYKKRYGKK